VGLQAIFLLFGKLLQELCNIPFAATTARESTSPSGNGIHIKTLLEQALNIAPPGAAAMAHDAICRAAILRVHGCFLTGLLTRLIVTFHILWIPETIKKRTDLRAQSLSNDLRFATSSNSVALNKIGITVNASSGALTVNAAALNKQASTLSMQLSLQQSAASMSTSSAGNQFGGYGIAYYQQMFR
jgi:hypothetical protein